MKARRRNLSELDGFDIKVYRELDQSLEDTWRAFENISNHYGYQSFDWIKHWYISVGHTYKQIELTIVVVSIKSETKYIFPMCIRTFHGIRILEWLGDAQSDYHAPLINSEENLSIDDFKDLWSHVLICIPMFDVLHFKKQPRMIGYQKNPFVSGMQTKIVDLTHFAILPNSWYAYEKEMGLKKIMQDSRRLRRNLDKEGELRFEISSDKETFSRFVNAMLEQKAVRLRDTRHSNLGYNPSRAKFYRSFDKSIGTNGNTHCSALLLDDQVIATHWGFFHEGRFYYMMPAFESRKWAKYGPGRLLLEELIKWSIEQDLKIFDFTIGDEDYKKQWAGSSMHLYESLISKTFKGSLFRYGLLIFHRMKRLIADSCLEVFGRKIWQKVNSKN